MDKALLNEAQNFIQKATQQLSLPASIAEEAEQIFLEASNNRLIHGKTIKSIALGALYVASRKHNIENLEKVAEAFLDPIKNVSSKYAAREIARSYRHLLKHLNINVRQTLDETEKDKEVCYVCFRINGEEFYKELRSHEYPVEVARTIVSWVPKIYKEKPVFLCGKGANIIKASLAYIGGILFMKHSPTQIEMAEWFNCTEVTIGANYRKCLKIMWEMRLVTEKEWNEKSAVRGSWKVSP